MNGSTKNALLALTICLFTSIPAHGQTRAESASDSTDHFIRYVPQRRMVAVDFNAKTHSGMLRGYDGDSLIMTSLRGQERLSLLDIDRIVLMPGRQKSTRTLHGMFITLYLGNLLALRAKGNPAYFYGHGGEDEEKFVFLAQLGIAASGAAIGYLFGMAANREEIFEFTGIAGTAAERRFRDWLGRESRDRRFHLRAQAAAIATRNVDESESKLDRAGIPDLYSISELLGEEYESSGGINLLRKLELTYSLKRNLEVGFAYVSLSEPTVARCHPCAKQELAVRGFYLISRANYRPRPERNPVSLFAGAGLGLADGAASLEVEGNFEGHPYLHRKVEVEINSASGYLFCGMDISISQVMSLALALDYALVSAVELPAIEQASVSAQKMKVGNAGIGLSLGMHF